MDLQTFEIMDDEGQDVVLDLGATRIKEIPGFIHDYDSDLLFDLTGDSDEQVYIKTMSDGGITDTINGKILQGYLDEKGINFVANHPGSLIMELEDFFTLFCY
jgi:hypothetical protein